MTTLRFSFSTFLLPLLIVVALHAPAFAQEPKWELEGHGGFSFTPGGPHGNTAMPAPAASFTTAGGHPSRRVSSWFFGEGATVLSQVQQQLQSQFPIRPNPLDSVLQGPLIEPGDGAVFGFRLGRRLSSRIIAELTVDRLPGVQEQEGTFNQYLAAADGFSNSWSSLLGSAVNATANFEHPTESQDRLLMTGAINFEFGTAGSLRPYLVGGGGIERRSDQTPTTSMIGEYQSQVIFGFPVRAIDQIELSGTTSRNSFVGVLGGGVRIPMSQRLGLRADARVYLRGNSDETFLSTLTPPARITGNTSGYFDIGINPAIQLQSLPRPSPDSEVSFSGPQISNFRTFEGTGIETSIAVTMGVFWKF